jgi:hypothetical protein
MRIRLPSGADATVSPNADPATLEALDEMFNQVKMVLTEETAGMPEPKPCGYLLCQHSRSKHKWKHKEGSQTIVQYAGCRVPGCPCGMYQPRGEGM